MAIGAFVLIILLIIFNASFIWAADRDVRVGRLEKTALRFRFTIFLRTFTAGESVLQTGHNLLRTFTAGH